MEIIFLFIALILLFIVLIIALANAENPAEATTFILLSLVIGAIYTACVLNPTQPTAINVYRGETTLKITYVDSIPTDSVVVFKDNNYENKRNNCWRLGTLLN